MSEGKGKSSEEMENLSETTKYVVRGTFGNMNEFKLNENWKQWCERLEQFFIANDVVSIKKVPILLTSIGPEAYALLCDLCTPEIPSEKTFDDLKKLMSDYLQPKPLTITERYKFKERKQLSDEGVAQFIASLRKLSVNCNFGDKLDEHLRDQIVWGLKNDSVKKRLLGEADLTFQRTVELALSQEAAMKDAAELGGDHSRINYSRGEKTTRYSAKGHTQHGSWRTNQSHGTSWRSNLQEPGSAPQLQRPVCFCCGKSNHLISQCRFKFKKCDFCGKIGHLKNMCKSRNNNGGETYKMQARPTSTNFKGRYNHSSKSHRPINQHFVDSIEKQDQPESKDEELLNQISKNLADKSFFYNEETNVDTSSEKLNESLSSSINYVQPICTVFNVEGIDMSFEVDTGSSVSAISFNDFKLHFAKLPLLNTSCIMLKSYTGDPIKSIGIIKPQVRLDSVVKKLDLYVIPKGGPPIVGRQWLMELNHPINMNLDKSFVNSIGLSNDKITEKPDLVNAFLSKYPNVFSENLGLYTKTKFKLYLKENAVPKFFKPRQLPISLKEPVEKELTRLVDCKIIQPIESSEWGTPIVPILKADGTIRVCGDYKVTINPHLKIDRYPIPRINDLFLALRGGKKYTRLDLSQAYQQVELEDSSKNIVTISTHKGLFQYNRLPYGVASAPGLFQREMEKLIVGIDGVVCFLDDIFLTGCNEEEHLSRLDKVLSRLSDAGLTLKKGKCAFFQDSVSFLGYTIDQHGLHPSVDKVDAIKNAPIPESVTQLKSFLGLVNYYSKFISNIATVLKPLYYLLKNDVKWHWSKEQDESFSKIKELMSSAKFLAHFDPELKVKLCCDASPYGVGCVLSNVMQNGEERPLGYASRTLTKAEAGYSQIDKEALAIIFGIKKFHHFLYCRKFILATDCKPLISIFSSKKGIPIMAASRLQRWCLFLSSYDYDIEYVKSDKNCVADALSRLPLKVTNENSSDDVTYFNLISSNVNVFNEIDVSKQTLKDPILCKVYNLILNGWISVPSNEDFKPYLVRKDELYIDKGCIMWGHRVVIPHNLKDYVLDELHSSHLGVVKMKAIARSYVWWPKLDQDIENISKSCQFCLSVKSNPPKALLHSWDWPSGPGHRLHADFLGPCVGKMYLVITDAYSKWPEIIEMKNITAETTIEAFRDYFSRWGLCYKLVTDNGPTFTSKEFENFVKNNAIFHLKIPPYHPASNGAAENCVKTFKKSVEILLKSGLPMKECISRYLLYYRNAPHCTTGRSPAELHIGRNLRMRLDRIRPNSSAHVEQKLEAQRRFSRGKRYVKFKEGESVMIKDYRSDQWIKGYILNEISPVSYRVRTVSGFVWKRHLDQLLSCTDRIMNAPNEIDSQELSNLPSRIPDSNIKPTSPIRLETSPSKQNDNCEIVPVPSESLNDIDPCNSSSVGKTPVTETDTVRRSKRCVKPRKILDL